MPDEKDKKSGLGLILKFLLISLVVMVALAVIGFGLLVGFCAISRR